MRTGWFLTILFAAVFCAEAGEVFRFDALPEAVSRNGMGRGYLDMTSRAKGIPLALKRPIEGEFTVSAWIRLANYPNGGRGGFTVANPATVATLDGSDMAAQLRINGKKLEFSVRRGGKWAGVAGGELPLDRWLLVSGTLVGKRLAIAVNGEALTEKEAVLPAGPFRLTGLVAGASGMRKLPGGIDEIRIDWPAVGNGELRKRVAARGAQYARPLLADWRPHTAELPYKYLRTAPGERYALAEGSSLFVAVLPWTGTGRNDLLVGDPPSFFGSRITVHRELDAGALPAPVFSDGCSVALQGTDFRRLDRGGDRFDLLANGRGTPFGGGELIFYSNSGKPGAPEFRAVQTVRVGGVPFGKAVPGTPAGWACEDIDGDGIPDLLISSNSSPNDIYFPDRESFWNWKRAENSGPGRGYDIDGNWLGDRYTMRLWWAKGVRRDGVPEFGPVRPVWVGDLDYQVQWRFYSPAMPPGLFRSEEGNFLLLAGDVDRLLALPYEVRRGEVRTVGAARPVLKDGKPLHGVYWASNIITADLNRDGKQEIIVSGNPGRAIMLTGSRIGEFTEAGSLQIEAGPVELDTLVTPVRADWDGDGLPDLICGDASGYLTLWQGTEDPLVYRASRYLRSGGRPIQVQAGSTGSLQGPNERRWGYTQPTVGDWDNDGQPEIITNDIKSDLLLWKKTAVSDELAVSAFTDTAGGKLLAAWRVRPAILPHRYGYTGDGRNALLYLDWEGDLVLGIPERPGSTRIVKVEKLNYQDGNVMRMCGIRGFWGRAKLTITDWDGDGRWDVLFGHHLGAQRDIWGKDKPSGATVAYFRNVGTNAKPVFTRVRDIRLKNGDRLDFHAHNASVWPTDLDGDGKEDLIVGAEDGKIYYFLRDELIWDE